MKKILIVLADYYGEISLSLLKSAKSNLNNFSLQSSTDYKKNTWIGKWYWKS